jgi:SNF2 family DNA or RNA helicase
MTLMLPSGNEKEPENEAEANALIAQLKESLALMEKKKESLKKVKPIIIRIRRLVGSMVILHINEYRMDVNSLLSSIPERSYNGKDQENSIPVGSLDQFLKDAKALPNVSILSNQGVTESIHEYLYAAPYTVSISNKINIKLNRVSTPNYFYEIPGFEWDDKKRTIHIPISEGWRLKETLEKFKISEQVVYEEEAMETISKQVGDRMRLDSIALAEDVPDFPEIPGLKDVVPRPFQKVGVKFFLLNGGSGLCCDEMGLGKTLQMIMLAMINGWRTLIICPASLKVNWLREIAKFTDEKVYELSGTTPNAWDISHIIANKPRFVIINYDVIGRSVEIDNSFRDAQGYYNQKIQTKFPWVEVLNICNFDLCVYDEVHYIKNKDSQRSVGARQITAKHIVGLSGTPILNRPGEFWPILHILDPKTFPAYDTFLRQYTWDGRRAKNVNELRELLKPIMIRRLKKDVIKELPPINRINHFHELTPKAKKIYNRILEGIYTKLAEWDPRSAGEQEAIANILVQIMRMKQVVAIDMIPSTADLATEVYDSTNKKVLIFSQFKPVCFGINQRLGDESLGFVDRTAGGEFITVNDSERQARIDKFQSDPNVKFLCVTEKTAKEGYNITAAEVVIFNDLFWTPAGHQQAEGRAYGRLSNLHPIDSYYRIGEGTISEWIMELLAAKMNIIEEVVEGVNKSRIAGDESIVMELIKNMKEGMWTRSKK